ncbi:MAG: serine/threonine protein kinase, partial [Cyanobacteria bacterium J06573_2]
MIGQLLAGRYKVLQILAEGGFGQTYICSDIHLPGKPKCVLKHLKTTSTLPENLEAARRLFQKEADTLQQLGNHDQIPRLLAYFDDN